jgi:hypothetical protein
MTLLTLASTPTLRATYDALRRLDVCLGLRLRIGAEIWRRWALDAAVAEARDWWAT